MSDEMIAYSAAGHPGKHRGRVSLGALMFGLFAAPIVWAGNLMVTYALASHACYPGDQPLARAIDGFDFAWPLILACYLVSLAVCAAGFAVSLRNWRIVGSESDGHLHHLTDIGEGRTRFLGIIGMGFSLLFFGAVLFGALTMAVETLCKV
jgi:hypothetical protein